MISRPSSLEPVNITSHGTRVFAALIKSRILKWGDYPGFSRWPRNVILNFLRGGREIWLQADEKKAICQKRGEAESDSEREDTDFGGGRRGREPRNARNVLSRLEKARKGILPRVSGGHVGLGW